MSPAKPIPMEWLPDPAGDHDYRLRVGGEWDDRVADNGEISEDPLPEHLPPPDSLPSAMIPSWRRRFAGSLITILFWFAPYLLLMQSFSLDDMGRPAALVIVFFVAAQSTFIAVAAWTIGAWKEGANPAKSLLGMRVVDEATRQPLSETKMLLRALIRMVPLAWPASAAMVLIRKDRKSLADLMLGSIVVDSMPTLEGGRLAEMEIERKFLVKNLETVPWGEGAPIEQGYLTTQTAQSLRVGIKGDMAALNLKGDRRGAARPETEVEIPVEMAHLLLPLCGSRRLTKTRYLVPDRSKVWEVDVFHGDLEGLVVAEIEMESPEEEVAVPDWCGEEVTDDDRYYNRSLAEAREPPVRRRPHREP